jgi:hypothetical protein
MPTTTTRRSLAPTLPSLFLFLQHQRRQRRRPRGQGRGLMTATTAATAPTPRPTLLTLSPGPPSAQSSSLRSNLFRKPSAPSNATSCTTSGPCDDQTNQPSFRAVTARSGFRRTSGGLGPGGIAGSLKPLPGRPRFGSSYNWLQSDRDWMRSWSAVKQPGSLCGRARNSQPPRLRTLPGVKRYRQGLETGSTSLRP